MKNLSTESVQLNWLSRYVPLIPYLTGEARNSLLEVGSGHRGVGCIIHSPFVGVDVGFDEPPTGPMTAVQYGGHVLPFQNEAFHTVVSMDVLEHVPPAQRAGFLKELTRVAARQVLVACPVGSDGTQADVLLGQLIHRMHMPEPGWLHEHEQWGLPEAQEIERQLDALENWKWRSVNTTGSLPCLVMLLCDLVPELAQWAAPLLEADEKALHDWILAGNFGPHFRKMYLLERGQGSARIDARDKTRFGASLKCPACGSKMFLEPGQRQLRCLSCRSICSKDARGVWLLDRPISVMPPLPDTTFVLEPNWLGSMDWVVVVHNFLRAFAPSDPCRLWLRANSQELRPEQVTGLLSPILAPFGEETFAELVLSDPEEAPRGERVVFLPKADLAHWTAAHFREVALSRGTAAP